jgi:hypothetical protein
MQHLLKNRRKRRKLYRYFVPRIPRVPVRVIGDSSRIVIARDTREEHLWVVKGLWEVRDKDLHSLRLQTGLLEIPLRVRQDL